METNKDISLFELQVDHESTIYLRETAKWARFLAILGIVGCVLFLLMGFFVLIAGLGTGSYTDAYSTGIMAVALSVGYIAVAVVCFFPFIYLFNFARRLRTALQHNDQAYLNASLRNLRGALRYLGVLAIIGLGLLVAMIVIGVTF
jgi:hypothetical protein